MIDILTILRYCSRVVAIGGWEEGRAGQGRGNLPDYSGIQHNLRSTYGTYALQKDRSFGAAPQGRNTMYEQEPELERAEEGQVGSGRGRRMGTGDWGSKGYELVILSEPLS